jgi:hypothetical protein
MVGEFMGGSGDGSLVTIPWPSSGAAATSNGAMKAREVTVLKKYMML